MVIPVLHHMANDEALNYGKNQGVVNRKTRVSGTRATILAYDIECSSGNNRQQMWKDQLKKKSFICCIFHSSLLIYNIDMDMRACMYHVCIHQLLFIYEKEVLCKISSVN